jgi:Mrp family chromosome partitioning ATPase
MPKTLIALLLALSAATTGADVLLIDGVEMDRQSATARPARGMTMQRVEAAFGAPSDRRAAIGEPPITRWDYPSFIVYFEHEHVIHSVARR